MKTLRYLLIAFAIITAVSVGAQSLAQEPSVQFQSTSSMVGSGSTLPQAAQDGSSTTYDGTAAELTRERPVLRGGRPGDWDNPYDNPIGDGMWILVALACCYAAFAAWRKQRVKMLNR